MATLTTSQFLDSALLDFAEADLDWPVDTYYCIFVDEGTDVVDSADDFVDDIAAGARINSSTESSNRVTNRSVAAGGVMDGDDTTMTAVGPAASVESFVIAREVSGDQTTPADDNLVLYVTGVTGLPLTPNGGNITIQWDSGNNKIMAFTDKT